MLFMVIKILIFYLKWDLEILILFIFNSFRSM